MPIPVTGNRSVMRTTSRTSLAFALLAFAALALATPPPDAAGRLSFDRLDAVVGTPTTAIQARDLNGDRRLDLVVSGGQSVFVLSGRGDGRFDVTWSGATGENPVDLAMRISTRMSLPTSRSQTTRRTMSRCSSGSPEGPSKAGTTRDSASTSRRTRTPFDCTISTPMAVPTLWSTTGHPSLAETPRISSRVRIGFSPKSVTQ